MGGSGFALQWPTDAGRTNKAFDNATGVVEIAAPAGAQVRTGAAGIVVAVESESVQVRSGQHVVVYSNLRRIQVQTGDELAVGATLGESGGPESIRLMVLQVIDPTPVLPDKPAEPVPAPTPTPDTSKLYVVALEKGVRLRERPVDGNPIMTVGPDDILEVIEAADGARLKLGQMDQWLNVRTLYGISGFCAARFFKAYSGPIPQPVPLPAGLVFGVNLDMNNRLGRPVPDRLKGVGWIRVKFNVSYNPDNNTYGNTDVNAAFNRMRPFLDPYVKAGIKVLLVFTHQLFGEGAGYHWPSMDSNRWNDLIPKYADFAKRAAALFAGTGLVHGYQIWNEQDTNPAVARAAVPIPAADYANMLTRTIRAIRSVDSKTLIITGGHVGGPDAGSAYARSTLAAMPPDVRPDGIASHPYGRGVSGNKFSPFGSLDDEIRKYAAVMPGKPVWLTEWGVLDRQGDLSVAADVGAYAAGFLNIIQARFPNQVAAAIWYAWADGMDNGYGLVDSSDRIKPALASRLLIV